jgi:malate dehydrogenase
MLGTSAWYAPGAAVSSLVHSIVCDQQKMFPCSAFLEGEFNLSDLCIGVPVLLGANGIEKIVEIDLDNSEKEKLASSAQGVRKTNDLLIEIGALS